MVWRHKICEFCLHVVANTVRLNVRVDKIVDNFINNKADKGFMTEGKNL